jgi:hypothetical protein
LTRSFKRLRNGADIPGKPPRTVKLLLRRSIGAAPWRASRALRVRGASTGSYNRMFDPGIAG